MKFVEAGSEAAMSQLGNHAGAQAIAIHDRGIRLSLSMAETPPSRASSVISDRQVQLLQEGGISRVAVQTLQ